MALQILVKQNWEERLWAFEFNEWLKAATVASVVNDTIIIAAAGKVTQTAALTADNIAISGQQVQAMFKGGTNGEEYHVTCRIVGSDSQRLELDGLVRIRDA